MTSRFIDQYAPEEFPGYPCATMPVWSTQTVRVSSGDEQTNQRWEDPLYNFMLPSVVRKMEHFNAINDQWLAMRGPFHSWPFRDPLDFASIPLPKPIEIPTITGYDQVIGTGDGEATEFQLIKTYTRGAQSYARPIYLPLTAFVILSIDGGAEFPALSVSRPGGVVTLAEPPDEGAVIRAGFYFDNEVRFESDDSFSGIVRNWQTAGVSDVMLIGVRHCTDGE